MAEFFFQGRDWEGKLISGKRLASSEEELASRLQHEGIMPIHIDEIKSRTFLSLPFLQYFKKQRVPIDELLMFCRQMYTLIKAGIPIITAITRLSETARTPLFSKILDDIIQTLHSGGTLAFALSRHPKVFPSLFSNIVSVGEKTGKLEDVFLQLSEYLRLEDDTKKRIKTTLRYPMLVVIAAITAILVINTFVVPAFAKMFSQYHSQLPLPTRILIASSNIMTHYWYFIIGFILLVIYGWIRYIHTSKGRLVWDTYKLKLPIFGWIIKRIYLARFCRLLALVLASGIPALEGLEMVSRSIGNVYIENRAVKMRDIISRGSSISKAATNVQLFSTLVLQMLALGEETGNLENMLIDAAGYYERETEYDLLKLTDALEPILLLVMAGMVLVLALGVFLPMWDMASIAQQR